MTLVSELVDVQITNDLQAFNMIEKHLLTQNSRSMSDGYSTGSCAYRGEETIYIQDPETGEAVEFEFVPNNKSCAVGILIKDKFYDSSLEDNSADEVNVHNSLSDSHPDWHINKNTTIMLLCCQYIHDTLPVKHWQKALDYLRGFIFFDKDHNVNFSGYISMVANHDIGIVNMRNVIMDFVKSRLYFEFKQFWGE